MIRETYLFWESKGELVDGYCYLTELTIRKRTLYGKVTQKTAIKTLLEHGYIQRVVKGMPRRQWFKLCDIPQSVEINLQVGRNQPTSKAKTTYKQGEINLQVGRNDTLSKTRDNTRNKTRVEEEKTPTTQPPRIDKDNKVVKLYKSKFGLPNTKVYDDIKNAIVLYGEEWCYEALKYSIGKNKYGWNYANGTLKGWSAEHPSTSKPWEMMMYANGNRKHIKQSEVDWENEPDGII